MHKLSVITIALMLCAAVAVSACQGPRPRPDATPPVQTSLACASGPDQPWHFWQSASTGVSSLLVERGEVWAGTQAGVFRVHPRTGAFTLTLDSQVSDLVYYLFPMGEGRVWAHAERGNFYYDGQRWTKVQIAGAGDKPAPLAIDLEGNFWVYSYGVKPGSSYYRLPGHVPPTDGSAWLATAMERKLGSDECQAQQGWSISSQAMLSFFYRSQAECQSLMRARPDVEKKFGNLMVLDADGSVWGISHGDSPTGAREGYPAKLRNLDLSIELNLPDYGLPRIAPDPVHGVWLGTGSGLAYSDGKSLRWVPLKLGECKVPSPLYDLIIDPQGKAWAAAGGKIRMLGPGESEWQYVSNPAQMDKPGYPLYRLTAASDGGMWATNGYDLLRLDGKAKSARMPESLCAMERLVADAQNVWAPITCKRMKAYFGVMQYDLASDKWALHLGSPDDRASGIAITTDESVYLDDVLDRG